MTSIINEIKATYPNLIFRLNKGDMKVSFIVKDLSVTKSIEYAELFAEEKDIFEEIEQRRLALIASFAEDIQEEKTEQTSNNSSFVEAVGEAFESKLND